MDWPWRWHLLPRQEEAGRATTAATSRALTRATLVVNAPALVTVELRAAAAVHQAVAAIALCSAGGAQAAAPWLLPLV